jgi:hypothetical protein
MGKVGRRVYHMPNSRTTIAIRLASRWLCMKLYMDGSAEPHCSRVKLEKAKSSDRKYWRMQRNKFKWFTKVWRLLSLDRRAMRIKEEEISHFKSEISYIPQSLTYERYPQIQGQREVSPKICRTIQDYWPQGRSGLSTWATTTVVGSAWCVSRITAEEVLTSTRGATTHGISWPWRRFDLQRKDNQDLG